MDNLKQIIKINNKKQVQAHNKQMYQTKFDAIMASDAFAEGCTFPALPIQVVDDPARISLVLRRFSSQ